MTTGARQLARLNGTPWTVKALLAGLLVFVAGSAFWVFSTARETAAQWTITSARFESADEVVASEALVAPVITSSQAGVSQPDETFTNIPDLPDFGRERITLLLLGIDRRCNEVGPTRTDSMMVVSMDPVAKTASVLSLPRDLWVEIPGFGLDRINKAHYQGEAFAYPGGGPALARETVAAALGIEVNYHVAVNFDAFIEVVDLIGGIDVEVPEEIDDPDYPDSCYGFDPFHIDTGLHRLDGATALKYARTRATEGGDVDRAGRQQQVVLAVRDRVMQLGMIPQLIRRTPELWQTFQSNVHTNLTLTEIRQLALLAQDIPRENIRSAVINYDYVIDQTTVDGQQVLVPLRDSIRQLRDEFFAPPAVPAAIIENLPDRMRRENARVTLYNGTPRFGLAGETQDYLRTLGVNVTEVGNADSSTIRTTRIIDYGNHPSTTLYLTQLMSIPPLNISNEDTPDGEVDVLIILGNDWSVPTE